jgi:hypothetical protein
MLNVVLTQTPASQMELLIGLFGKLSDKQIEQMAKLLVSRTDWDNVSLV